jgi:DNA repair photolyase
MLNKSTGNMYTFVNRTWNTIKGECPHGCSYCYCKRWGKQAPLHFDEKELKTDLGSGNFIFVGSSCDMWAEGMPWEWVYKTLYHCESFGNQYLFQTKNPIKIFDYRNSLPDNFILCTTIETNRFYEKTMGNTPNPYLRANCLAYYDYYKKFITVEPILDFDLIEMIGLIQMSNPEQVNIGADSGNNHLPEPSGEKVLELIAELSKFTRVVQKKNLARLLNGN